MALNPIRSFIVLPVLLLAGSALLGAVAGGFSLVEDYSAAFWHDDQPGRPALWHILMIPFAVGILGMVRQRWFQGTEGTGIPQTIAALNRPPEDPLRRRLLSWRVAVGKLILTSGGLLSGASLGREGPTVQIGACLLDRIVNRRWLPDHLRERGLLLAGGAAGIAASFNAPIAGLVFACEEIGRRFDKRQMPTQVFVVVTACIVAVLLGSRFYFYGRHSVEFGGWWSWLGVLVIAPVAGLLGGCFARLLQVLFPLLAGVIRQRPFAVCFGLGLILALCGWLSSGSTIGSGYGQAHALVEGNADYGLVYFCGRFFVTLVTLCSGIPGGLFDPSLSAGAGLGAGFGRLWQPEALQAFVLIGMAAYFAGVVQSPMTAAIILVEMTGAIGLTLPLFAATLIAYQCSRLVCRTSLYESLAASISSSGAGSSTGNASINSASERLSRDRDR